MPEGSEHIVISRTDSIGDVMLSLPMAGLLKKRFPRSYITFLGRAYTVPVLERCTHIDNIITLEQLTLNGERGGIELLRRSHIDAIVHVFPVRKIARWAAWPRSRTESGPIAVGGIGYTATIGSN